MMPFCVCLIYWLATQWFQAMTLRGIDRECVVGEYPIAR
jgi:hypothetical protein